MKKLVIGSLLAALAMFAWGAVFWMSPLPKQLMGTVKSEDAVIETLLGQLGNSTTYALPMQTEDANAWQAKVQRGPLAIIHFQREGCPSMAQQLVRGFLIEWVTTALLSVLLLMASAALPSYKSRVLFILVAGLSLAVFIDAGSTVWWHHTPGWALLNAVHNIGAWGIAGLVLAKFVGAPGRSANP